MAKKEVDPNEPPAGKPKPKKKRTRKRTRRDPAATVHQVAYAIRHRDEIVEHALEVLHAVGAIDEGTRDHVHGLYERGDARTRLIIQELIARVMHVPVERMEQALADEEWDADQMSGRALDALAELELPEVHVKETADWVRHLDVDALLTRVEHKSRVLEFVGDVPVKVHHVQRNMMAVGIMLLVVVVASLLFPNQAQLIAFFAFLALVALVGGLLVWWSWRIRRLARDADFDLAVLARLKPEERRLLLLRRIVLQVFDRDKAGDLLERGLDAVVPELLRGTPRDAAAAATSGAAPPKAQGRPARPVKPSPEVQDATASTSDTRKAKTTNRKTATRKRATGKATGKDSAKQGAAPAESSAKRTRSGARKQAPAGDKTAKRPRKKGSRTKGDA